MPSVFDNLRVLVPSQPADAAEGNEAQGRRPKPESEGRLPSSLKSRSIPGAGHNRIPLHLRYCAGSGRSVPRRSARSFINTKKTGTRIST